MKFKARLAGLFYLLTGGTAYAFFIRGKILAAGSAAASAAKIAASEQTYRAAFVADILGVAAYVVVTALFYELFKNVDRTLALTATFFSVIGCAIQGSAAAFSMAALRSLGDQPPSLTLLLLRTQGSGFGVAIVFFGVYCFLIGWLIVRSRLIPRAIGVLMILAGITYVLGNTSGFLALPVAKILIPAEQIFGGAGELLLMLWLLIFGVKEETARVPAPALSSAT